MSAQAVAGLVPSIVFGGKATISGRRFAEEGGVAAPATRQQRPALPHNTEWHWYPGLWQSRETPHASGSRGRGAPPWAGVSLHHGNAGTRASLVRMDASEESAAPMALRCDIDRCPGGFVAIAVDLPAEATVGLCREHLVRFQGRVSAPRVAAVFMRLNIQCGPNIDQVVRAWPPEADPSFVEFDLFYTQLDADRIDKLWLDMIFNEPGHGAIDIEDVCFSRRRRAQF